MKWYLIVVQILIFLMTTGVEHIFVCHLCIFFGEMLVKVLWASFKLCFILLLSYQSSLCILDTRLLSHIWFTSTFSHSLSRCSVPLVMSFEAQSPLILMTLNLFFLLLLVFFGAYPRIHCQIQDHENLPLCFFSKDFTDLASILS